MTLKEIHTLYAYDGWASLRTLESAAGLTPEEYAKNLGSSFGSIHGTLVHILSADRVWLHRWLGTPAMLMKPEDIPAIEVLKKYWDSHFLELSNFLRMLTDEKISAPFPYTDFKNTVHSQILDQQMQHKVNHSTYHRGQIAVLLRQLNAKPVGTDLITYYREQETHD